MEKLVYNTLNIRYLLLLVVMVSAANISAKDYTKELLRNFKVNSDAKLYVDNSRGNVNITTWDKNTIKIEAKIVVSAKDATQAEEFFKQIKINFEKNPAYVKATTEKKKQEESWTEWLWGSAKNWDWSVEYEITMPKTNRLSAINKFGDLYVSGVKGDSKIQLKYGDFKLSNFSNLDCQLANGEGTISNVKNLDVDIQYCEIKLRNAKNIDIISKHSEIDIDEASEIRSTSKYDDFEIGSVTQLNSTGKYDDFIIGKVGTINAVGKNSDFEIESILESGTFNVEYGEVIIDNLATSLEKLKLIGEYTEFVIDTEGGTFNIVLDSDATEVKTPKAMENKTKKTDDNVLKFNGKVGKGTSNSLIEIRTKKGSLRIIEQ